MSDYVLNPFNVGDAVQRIDGGFKGTLLNKDASGLWEVRDQNGVRDQFWDEENFERARQLNGEDD